MLLACNSYITLRISNLIGQGLPCHGSRCRFEPDLIRIPAASKKLRRNSLAGEGAIILRGNFLLLSGRHDEKHVFFFINYLGGGP